MHENKKLAINETCKWVEILIAIGKIISQTNSEKFVLAGTRITSLYKSEFPMLSTLRAFFSLQAVID